MEERPGKKEGGERREIKRKNGLMSGLVSVK